MRCPKCGFISFDQQASCTKCSADLTATPSSYKGTGNRTTAPFFLGSALPAAAGEEPAASPPFEAPEAEQATEGTAALFEALETESQGIGMFAAEPAEEAPELELTINEEEEHEIAFDLAASEESPADELPSLALDDQEEAPEIELDLAAPEESPADELPSLALDDQEEAAQPASSLDLEAIDLSDLIDTKSSTPHSSRNDIDDDEIFDLSALMGDTEEEDSRIVDEPAGDEFRLEIDSGDDPPQTDGEKTKAKPTLESSGLALEGDNE